MSDRPRLPAGVAVRLDVRANGVEVTLRNRMTRAEFATMLRAIADAYEGGVAVVSEGRPVGGTSADRRTTPCRGTCRPDRRAVAGSMAGLDVAGLLLSARIERCMSYRDVAEETGLSTSTLHHIENGGDPRWSTVSVLLAWIADSPNRFVNLSPDDAPTR